MINELSTGRCDCDKHQQIPKQMYPINVRINAASFLNTQSEIDVGILKTGMNTSISSMMHPSEAGKVGNGIVRSLRE